MPYKDHDKHLEHCRNYLKKHREKNKQVSKKYYNEHKEERKIIDKLYYEENKIKKAAQMKLYRDTHVEEQKAYRDKNRDKRRENTIKRIRNIEIIEHVNKELLIFSHQGRCAYCQKDLTNDRTTHIDHLIPVSRYAKLGKKCPHKYSTVVPTCSKCNHEKNNKTPLEFMWAKN